MRNSVPFLNPLVLPLVRCHAGFPATRESDQFWGGIPVPGQRLLRPAAALSDRNHERPRAAQLARRELLQKVPLPLQEEYVTLSLAEKLCLWFQTQHPNIIAFYFSPTGQTCVDIKDNVVNEGYYFTPKGDDPCLSCTCHDGEPEMCVAALCERPQGCQHFRKDPKECCKFTCLDPGTDEQFPMRLPLNFTNIISHDSSSWSRIRKFRTVTLLHQCLTLDFV